MIEIWIGTQNDEGWSLTIVDMPWWIRLIDKILYQLAELPRFLGGGWFQSQEFKWINATFRFKTECATEVRIPVSEDIARAIFERIWKDRDETFEETFSYSYLMRDRYTDDDAND
jgi:hypothetical protein